MRCWPEQNCNSRYGINQYRHQLYSGLLSDEMTNLSYTSQVNKKQTLATFWTCSFIVSSQFNCVLRSWTDLTGLMGSLAICRLHSSWLKLQEVMPWAKPRQRWNFSNKNWNKKLGSRFEKTKIEIKPPWENENDIEIKIKSPKTYRN